MPLNEPIWAAVKVTPGLDGIAVKVANVGLVDHCHPETVPKVPPATKFAGLPQTVCAAGVTVPPTIGVTVTETVADLVQTVGAGVLALAVYVVVVDGIA